MGNKHTRQLILVVVGRVSSLGVSREEVTSVPRSYSSAALSPSTISVRARTRRVFKVQRGICLTILDEVYVSKLLY